MFIIMLWYICGIFDVPDVYDVTTLPDRHTDNNG